jgi:prophage regulatory protein
VTILASHGQPVRNEKNSAGFALNTNQSGGIIYMSSFTALSQSTQPHLKDVDGFLRLSQVLTIIPVGKSTWWNWVKTGKAPKATKLGGKITVWRISEINEFMNSY